MNELAIEDLATVLIGEFVKEHKYSLQIENVDYDSKHYTRREIPFIKMNFNQRKRLVSKTLDKLI